MGGRLKRNFNRCCSRRRTGLRCLQRHTQTKMTAMLDWRRRDHAIIMTSETFMSRTIWNSIQSWYSKTIIIRSYSSWKLRSTRVLNGRSQSLHRTSPAPVLSLIRTQKLRLGFLSATTLWLGQRLMERTLVSSSLSDKSQKKSSPRVVIATPKVGIDGQGLKRAFATDKPFATFMMWSTIHQAHLRRKNHGRDYLGIPCQNTMRIKMKTLSLGSRRTTISIVGEISMKTLTGHKMAL